MSWARRRSGWHPGTRCAPDAFGTARFRADDLVRRNHPDQALKVLDKFAERPNVSAEELLAGQRLVAEMLEQLADRLSEAHQRADGRRRTLPEKGGVVVPPLCRPAPAGRDAAGRLSRPPRTACRKRST